MQGLRPYVPPAPGGPADHRDLVRSVYPWKWLQTTVVARTYRRRPATTQDHSAGPAADGPRTGADGGRLLGRERKSWPSSEWWVNRIAIAAGAARTAQGVTIAGGLPVRRPSIASVATVALIMAPSSGSGASGTWSGPALETADRAVLTAGELPIFDGSAPVGLPTGQTRIRVYPRSRGLIEAESGSPTVGSRRHPPSSNPTTGHQVVLYRHQAGNGGDGTQPGTTKINGISVPSSGTYRISIMMMRTGTSP